MDRVIRGKAPEPPFRTKKKGYISMENKNHVITRNNIEQEVLKSVRSDVVIHNKLGNSETCRGLRHWRLLSNLKNNFSKPVRNDLKRHPEDDKPKDLSTNVNLKLSPEFVSSPKLTNKFYPQLSALDSHVSPQLNGSLCITKREGKKNGNELNNLSTYRLIDFKKILRLKPQNDENIKILVPECPSALMPLKKKFAFTLAEVLITLGIIGVVAAITIPGLMTKYRRSVVEKKLIKFESIMNQAIRMSISENDDLVFSPPENVSERTPYMKEWLQENLLKFMKAEYDGEIINNRYCKISFIDGTGVVVYPSDNGSRIHFFFCLESKDATCKPESYDGRNTFVFVYDQKTKAVLPYGYEVNDVKKLKYSAGLSNAGCYTTAYPTHRHYCAQLIKQNGWKIPADYPWIK